MNEQQHFATSTDIQYTAEYGYSIEDGLYIMVYDEAADEHIVDKTEAADGIDGIGMFVIAHQYGVGDAVYNWLNDRRPNWAARWYD